MNADEHVRRTTERRARRRVDGADLVRDDVRAGRGGEEEEEEEGQEAWVGGLCFTDLLLCWMAQGARRRTSHKYLSPFAGSSPLGLPSPPPSPTVGGARSFA